MGAAARFTEHRVIARTAADDDAGCFRNAIRRQRLLRPRLPKSIASLLATKSSCSVGDDQLPPLRPISADGPDDLGNGVVYSSSDF